MSLIQAVAAERGTDDQAVQQQIEFARESAK